MIIQVFVFVNTFCMKLNQSLSSKHVSFIVLIIDTNTGNVAQDLREWIEAVGYEVTVTGGGRIDYRKSEGIAIVYGFSYGFGKGDHALAASLINKWKNGTITAYYDHFLNI
jgi:hypothetical protein